jgi:hypothetical protein
VEYDRTGRVIKGQEVKKRSRCGSGAADCGVFWAGGIQFVDDSRCHRFVGQYHDVARQYHGVVRYVCIRLAGWVQEEQHSRDEACMQLPTGGQSMRARRHLALCCSSALLSASRRTPYRITR